MVTPDEWPLRRRSVFARQNPAYRPAGTFSETAALSWPLRDAQKTQVCAQYSEQAVHKSGRQWITFPQRYALSTGEA